MAQAEEMHGAELLHGSSAEEAARYRALLDQLSEELFGQIRGQRELLMADSGELPVRSEVVDASELLSQVAALYGGGRVELDLSREPARLETDRVLLGRVLANMLKNAAEAAEDGETIRAGVTVEGERLTFWVRNRAVLAPEVKLQVFQRSFSTKGAGRGLGAYSMKLLGERYLGRSVTFTSRDAEGTTFRATFRAGRRRAPAPGPTAPA